MRNGQLNGSIYTDRVYRLKFLVQFNAPIVLILLFSCNCFVFFTEFLHFSFDSLSSEGNSQGDTPPT